MNERKYFWYDDELGWDGFFGPFMTKEDAIAAAEKHPNVDYEIIITSPMETVYRKGETK